MKRSFIWLALGGFVAFLLTLICLADAGHGQRLYLLAACMPAGDKVGHVFLFGMLTLLANVAAKGARIPWGGVTVLKGSLFVLVPVVLEEFSQLAFRSRSFEILDLLADGVAVLLGGWLAMRLLRWTGTAPLVRQPAPREAMGAESESANGDPAQNLVAATLHTQARAANASSTRAISRLDS